MRFKLMTGAIVNVQDTQLSILVLKQNACKGAHKLLLEKGKSQQFRSLLGDILTQKRILFPDQAEWVILAYLRSQFQGQ